MTDGQNNVDGLDQATANTRTVNAANATKPGWDGTLNTPDDIEIYTIGFFDSGSGESGLIGTNPPGCPSSTLPGGRTATDNMLIQASSSTPGSCDHYYPVGKNMSLPPIFGQIAGALGRARLID